MMMMMMMLLKDAVSSNMYFARCQQMEIYDSAESVKSLQKVWRVCQIILID